MYDGRFVRVRGCSALPLGRRYVLNGGLFEDVSSAGRAEPDDVGQAHLGIGDLAVAGLTPEVVADLPDVGDAGGGDGVALGLQAARHVDGGAAVAPGGAGLEEVDRSPFLSQPEVVVGDELGGGEAVVQLDEVGGLGA